MKPNSRIYTQHILDAIENIYQFSKGLDFESFIKNTEKQAAITRMFEIIGEAARQLAGHISAKDSSIPWTQMISMRNILTHEYFDVDLELMWETMQNDLPKLKEAIAKLHATL